MKTIIAGGRTITDMDHLMDAFMSCPFPVKSVVSGAARGVDALGEQYAKQVGLPLERFPADWARHGRGAGHIRNRQMAEHAEALILVWDGKSRGSANMLKEARARGLRIHQHIVEAQHS